MVLCRHELPSSSRAFGFWRSKTRQQKQRRKKEVTSQKWSHVNRVRVGVLSLCTLNCSAVTIFFLAPSRPQQEKSRACVLCTIVQSFNLMSTAKSQATREALHTAPATQPLSSPLPFHLAALCSERLRNHSGLQRSCHTRKQFVPKYVSNGRFVQRAALALVLWGNTLLSV